MLDIDSNVKKKINYPTNPGTTGQVLVKANNTDNTVTWADAGNPSASNITFDNTDTSLESNTVQNAINEVFQYANDLVDDHNNALVLYKQTIVGKGGTVEQVGNIPSINEINSGIESIPQNGGSLITEVYLYKDGNEYVNISGGWDIDRKSVV